ncbi:MAG: MFS transporter [Bacteroidia bacterium]|nr:MFS transporter [Bacteroidia bacterium]
MAKRPRLSFWQIWNMSFGFLGIQFGYALQNANVSRIFESLGASVESIPILWIAAPVTGLIIQPIIGHMSDKTWTRLGRRRPYFLVGAIMASAALFIMPNSGALWIAAGMLWIMDASINISMEPFRAFIGDMLPSEQRTLGFSMQSFFIGIGAVVGSALPYILANWFGVSNEPVGSSPIPPTVKWSFYLGGIVFLSAVLVTVFTTREYTPEQIASFNEHDASKNFGHSDNHYGRDISARMFSSTGMWFLLSGLIIALVVWQLNFETEVYILAGILALFGLIFFISALLRSAGRTKSGVVEIMTDLLNMPKTMGQLAVVQFFTWLALFSMWIYTTPAVTAFHYHADSATSELYNEGANWVGVLFGAYSLFAALFAFLLPVLARRISRKLTHLVSLVVGGMGLISMYFITDPTLLLLSMAGVGLAWASILAMPYAMLTGALPQEKMGIYMGIFNFFIVLPQILAATILGAITKHLFHGEAIYALVFGGVSMIIAGFFTLRVTDKDDVFAFLKRRL